MSTLASMTGASLRSKEVLYILSIRVDDISVFFFLIRKFQFNRPLPFSAPCLCIMLGVQVEARPRGLGKGRYKQQTGASQRKSCTFCIISVRYEEEPRPLSLGPI